MASKAINSNSKFNIYASSNLSADDVNTLSLLYAPLIGSDAFLLYMGLYSFLDRGTLKAGSLTHQNLFDTYSINPNQFIKARIQLEGIGLLLSYIDEEGNYTYVLNPPYSAKNFIYDSPFINYLKDKIEEKAFDRLIKSFLIETIDKSKLTNVTKSFDEVFESQIYNDEVVKRFGYILGRNVTKGIKINESNFDIDKFIKEIEKSFLPLGVTEEFKKQIIQVAFVYQFDENIMVQLYSDSIDAKGEFSYKMLIDKANLFSKKRRNRENPRLTLKDKNEAFNSKVEYLNNVTPKDLLEQINPNYPEDYLKTINKLYGMDFETGAINCMISKVAKDKNGELPGVSYFEKVAESWIRDNVYTTADAIKYVTEAKDSKGSRHTKSKLKDNPIDDENGGFTIL